MSASSRVFIVGAGATKSHTGGIAPVATELFSKAAEFGIDFANPYYPASWRELKAFAAEFGVHLGLDTNRTNLEDIFTFLEIEIERSRAPRLQQARLQLIRLITETFDGVARRVPAGDGGGEYHSLSSMLESGDSVVTFNWDTFLDDALGRPEVLKVHYEKGERTYPDSHYGRFVLGISAIGWRTWKGITPDVPTKTAGPDHGVYLKLHGSLDWFYCCNDLCRACNRVYPYPDPANEPYCAECGEVTLRLIIPPVLNKRPREFPIVRRIWNAAAGHLNRASDLVVWGYSLPPTDYYSQWLLRQAKGHRLKRLALVNPDVTEIEFLRRFVGVYLPGLASSGATLELYRSFGEYRSSTPWRRFAGLEINEAITRGRTPAA